MVRWQPSLPAEADYEVLVSYTAHANRAADAPYTVRHAGGGTRVTVDQTVPGRPDPRTGEWTSLGVFHCNAGIGTTVELSDDADGYVIADAVRFVRKD